MSAFASLLQPPALDATTLVHEFVADLDLALLDVEDENDEDTSLEPFHEPCHDAIAASELAFWLGNPSPNCACCSLPQAPVGHYVYIPTSPERGLSPKIPVIPVPGIQGIN